jgi:hypothetical protein
VYATCNWQSSISAAGIDKYLSDKLEFRLLTQHNNIQATAPSLTANAGCQLQLDKEVFVIERFLKHWPLAEIFLFFNISSLRSS